MSRIRRVGGKMIERIGGDYNIYSRGDIVYTSSKQIINIGKEEGVVFGDCKEMIFPSDCLAVHCVVHFRPQEGWTGAYGFDWMRMGDGETAFKGDIIYRNYVTKALGATDQAQAYKKLKDVYDKDRKHLPWNLEREVIDKKVVIVDENGAVIEEYYPSWLMLFPEQIKDEETGEWKASGYENTNATLSMIVDNRAKGIESYKLEYDEELFELSHDKIPTEKDTYKNNLAFNIRCLKPFTEVQEIKVIAQLSEEVARTKNPFTEKIVGKLKLLDNAFIHQPKIVLVKVTSNFEKVDDPKTGEPKSAPEPDIKKYLRQALMVPKEIVWDELDITEVKEEKYFGSGSDVPEVCNRNERFLRYREVVADGTARIIHTKQLLQTDLAEALAYQTNNKYKDHFKVFYIDEATIVDNGEFRQFKGISYPIPDFRTCIIFRGGLKDKDTVVHELLHAMGLRHSFDEENLFVFRENDTDNIMDYDEVSKGVQNSPDKLHLWKWQIDILRENAKNNKFIRKP